jgi:hypothetical protein
MSAIARRIAVALALSACAGSAGAELLYKFVDAKGLTTIQQSPCAKGSTQAWARDSAPEPPPTPEQLAAEQARRDALAQQQVREAEQRLKEQEEARERAKTAPPPPPPPSLPPPPAPSPAVEAGAPPPDADEAACNEARAFGAAVRDKPWLELDGTQQQRLYAWVVQQCKGVKPRLPGRR